MGVQFSDEPYYILCKSCYIHRIGVFVVGIGGLVFMVLIIVVYWHEIKAILNGEWRRQPNIEAQPFVLTSQQPTPLSMTLATINPGTLTSVSSPQSPTSPGDPTRLIDPFKLPTSPRSPAGIRVHESTGSHYFKQMIKGKKPVTSISQYILKKSHKKKHKTKKNKDEAAKKKDETTKKKDETTKKKDKK